MQPKYHKSDLTGEAMTETNDLVDVIVRKHPALEGEGVVFLRASLPELAGITNQPLATLELWFADGSTATVNVDATAFDANITRQPGPRL